MTICAWERLRKARFSAFLFFAAVTVFSRVEAMIVVGASTGFAGIQHNRDDPQTYAVLLPYDVLYTILS